MGGYYDVMEGMKLAWKRFRDPQLVQWVGLQTLFGFAILLMMAALIVAALGTEVITGLISKSSPMDFDTLIHVLIVAGGIIAAAILVQLLVDFFFFLPRILRAAMATAGIKTPRQPGMMEWLALFVRQFFVNAFCWYDKKLLIPFVVLLALTIIVTLAGWGQPFAIVGAVLIGMVTLAAWAIAYRVHALRTMFAPYMFLRGDGPESEMVAKSARLVRGQTLEVFLGLLVFGVCVGAVYLAIYIVGFILGLIPVIGFVLKFALELALGFGLMLYSQAFTADFFKFYDNAGPAAPGKSAKASTPMNNAKKK